MATTIDLDSTPFNPEQNFTDTQAPGLPTDITDRIPTLSPKEGLGSTHTVTAGAVQQLNSKEAFERAKKDAEDDSIGTAKRIHEYGITDKKMLFEIAKIMVSKASFIYDPNSSTLIANFIKDPEMRLELAKIINCWGNVDGKFITEFGITDLNQQLELIKFSIQKGYFTIESLKKFKITDQTMLFEFGIAIVNASIVNASMVVYLFDYIKKLGITDQRLFEELIKIIVEKHSYLLARVIKEFGITDPNQVFELAKISVKTYGGFDFEQFMKTEGLTQQMRFEIAKMIAARSSALNQRNLALYKITDQTMLFEIAKIAASRWYLDKKIADFGVTDQTMLFEIAKIAVVNLASKGDQLSSSYIKDLLRYFGISDGKKIYEILKIFISHGNCRTLRDLEGILSLVDEKQLREAYIQFKDFAISQGASSKILESLEDLFFKGRHSLQQQKKDLFWLCELVLHYALESTLPQSPLNDEEMGPILKCIGKMTDPLLRRDATNALRAIYQHPDKIRNLKSLLAGKEERHYLFVLFSVSLGLEPEHTTKIVEELSAAKYKDAAVMASIYQMMNAFGKSSLPDAKKKQFLEQIFNLPVRKEREKQSEYQKKLEDYRKNQRNTIAAVTSLLYFGQEQILLDVEDTTTLVSQWQTYMGEVFDIKSDNLSNFLPTFGSSKRRPNGLMTYAARLQTLPQEEKGKLMPLLGKFASAVLDGTFHQMRYDITNNQHMQALFSDNGDLLKKWQTSLQIKIEGTSSSGKTISPQERVQKLMRDALDNHHLEKEPTEEIEGLCQTVLNPNTDLPQLQAALESLQKLVTDPSSQFHHDLKGMMTALTVPEAPAKKWIIEDTDAWEDFLLMGTETDNSCQHIERNPQYNKCVIASMWDPKIRLMVARDPESGKILGRVVYRILLPKREIFVERLYIRNGINYDEVKRDILEGCRQKAEVMGSTLVSSAGDYSGFAEKRYPVTLQSLGGPAPYEYVDALSGIQNDGVYSLKDNIVLWSPPAAMVQ